MAPPGPSHSHSKLCDRPLSTVSDEFCAYRDQLRGDLTRHNCKRVIPGPGAIHLLGVMERDEGNSNHGAISMARRTFGRSILDVFELNMIKTLHIP